MSTISQSVLTKLKTHGYTNVEDWIDLNAIPETMRDGSVFVELQNIGTADVQFKLRNTSKVSPVMRSLRFSLINQRNKMTLDQYCDKVQSVILDVIALDKSAHPETVLLETELGPVLQDARFYVYQFSLKITVVS